MDKQTLLSAQQILPSVIIVNLLCNPHTKYWPLSFWPAFTKQTNQIRATSFCSLNYQRKFYLQNGFHRIHSGMSVANYFIVFLVLFCPYRNVLLLSKNKTVFWKRNELSTILGKKVTDVSFSWLFSDLTPSAPPSHAL